jgi:hypothetical protein
MPARLWSPDSRYIAFFMGNQLKKIAPSGGPTQLICEGSAGADGAWGASGTILFDGRVTDPIHRVDAAGGQAAETSKPDASKGEAGHAWPYFLPDGKHFLFLATSNTPQKKGMIKVGTLGATTSSPLIPSSSRAEYANGYLFDALVAHRFDADKLSPRASPFLLAENINADERGRGVRRRPRARRSQTVDGGVPASSGGPRCKELETSENRRVSRHRAS